MIPVLRVPGYIYPQAWLHDRARHLAKRVSLPDKLGRCDEHAKNASACVEVQPLQTMLGQTGMEELAALAIHLNAAADHNIGQLGLVKASPQRFG